MLMNRPQGTSLKEPRIRPWVGACCPSWATLQRLGWGLCLVDHGRRAWVTGAVAGLDVMRYPDCGGLTARARPRRERERRYWSADYSTRVSAAAGGATKVPAAHRTGPPPRAPASEPPATAVRAVGRTTCPLIMH